MTKQNQKKVRRYLEGKVGTEYVEVSLNKLPEEGDVINSGEMYTQLVYKKDKDNNFSTLGRVDDHFIEIKAYKFLEQMTASPRLFNYLLKKKPTERISGGSHYFGFDKILTEAGL
jgi:hypothetical protein